jgi:WD40 repeat protein
MTGRPPFQAASALDTLLQVMEREPVPVRQLNAAVPKDLETICLKCLEKEPKRRYGSARDLAEELQRFLDGRPILARPVSVRERAVKWVRRRPAIAGLSGAIVVLSLAGLAGVLWQWRAAVQERRLAESRLYGSQITLASHEWDAFHVDRVEPILNECTPQLRGWEWRYLRRRCHTELFTIPSTGRKRLVDLALSPDGSLVVTPDLLNIKVWDLRTRRAAPLLAGHEYVSHVAFSPDGSRLVSASGDLKVILWDTATRQQLRAFSRSKPGPEGASFDPEAGPVAFRPDGVQVTAGGRDGVITSWEIRSGREIPGPPAHSGPITALAYSPDGARLASAGRDGKVRVWDLPAGRERWVFPARESRHLAFSPDGARLAATGPIRIWSLASGRELVTLKGHAGRENAIVFSPDGKRLATTGDDQTVRVWDAESGDELLVLRGHTAAVTGVAFDRAGARLISAGRDGMVKVWDATEGHEVLKVGPIMSSPPADRTARVRWSLALPSPGCLSFHPDGTILATPQGAGMIALWDVASGKRIRSLFGSVLAVGALSFSPDGARIATIGADSQVRLLDATTGQSRIEFGSQPGHSALNRGVLFSPDGSRLASFSNAGEVTVWEASTGKKLAELVPSGPRIYVTALAYSPDGRRIASSHRAAGISVSIWDVATGRETRMALEYNQPVNALVFSPDGRFLLSGDSDDIKVGDAATGAFVRSLRGHRGPIRALAYSPDGRRIASAAEDGLVKLWDAATGQELLTLDGGCEFLLSVSFSPDGRRLTAAGSDAWVRIWDAGP